MFLNQYVCIYVRFLIIQLSVSSVLRKQAKCRTNTSTYTSCTVYSPQHRLQCTQTLSFALHLSQLYSWDGRLEPSKISTSFPSVPAFPLKQRQYCTWRQQVSPQRRYISTSFHGFIFQAALILDSEIYVVHCCGNFGVQKAKFFPHAINL